MEKPSLTHPCHVKWVNISWTQWPQLAANHDSHRASPPRWATWPQPCTGESPLSRKVLPVALEIWMFIFPFSPKISISMGCQVFPGCICLWKTTEKINYILEKRVLFRVEVVAKIARFLSFYHSNKTVPTLSLSALIHPTRPPLYLLPQSSSLSLRMGDAGRYLLLPFGFSTWSRLTLEWGEIVLLSLGLVSDCIRRAHHFIGSSIHLLTKSLFIYSLNDSYLVWALHKSQDANNSDG